MSEREKQIAKKLADACEQLPEGKKEFLMGYAEGVAAMVRKTSRKEKDNEPPREGQKEQLRQARG